jgi:hypothetical protein
LEEEKNHSEQVFYKFFNHEMHEFSRNGRKETGRARRAGLAAFLQTHSQASLQMGFEKLRSIRFANDPVCALR